MLCCSSRRRRMVYAVNDGRIWIDGWMDGWMGDGASLAWLSVTHSQFNDRCHMSPPFSRPLPLASSPPGKPYPLHTPTYRSLLTHSPHSLAPLSTTCPIPHSPIPVPLVLQQLDSLALASAPFPSPTILPPFHLTTASNHLHSPRVVYR